MLNDVGLLLVIIGFPLWLYGLIAELWTYRDQQPEVTESRPYQWPKPETPAPRSVDRRRSIRPELRSKYGVALLVGVTLYIAGMFLRLIG